MYLFYTVREMAILRIAILLIVFPFLSVRDIASQKNHIIVLRADRF